MREKYSYMDYVDKENPDAPGLYLAQAFGGEWEDKWEKIEIAAFTKQEIIDYINERLSYYDNIINNSIDSDLYCDLTNDYEDYIIDKLYPEVHGDFNKMDNTMWNEVYKFTDCDNDEETICNLMEYIGKTDNPIYKDITEEQLRNSITTRDCWFEKPGYFILKVPMTGQSLKQFIELTNDTER